MPTCLYIRGVPGSGKRTVSDILERDLGWPVLWVHHFDAVYRAIGEYKVPYLTDLLIRDVAKHIIKNQQRDFMIVRPARRMAALWYIKGIAKYNKYTFLPIQLTAPYATLVQRVTSRQCGNESPFRLTTKEALDEYLSAWPEESFHGETVIDTDKLSPEQVAGKIKELLP